MADIELGGTISKQAFPSRTERKDANGKSGDAILTHYLKRLDPQIAASFTEEQRNALKSLLGARGMARHSLEIRRSLRFGKRCFYLVFLLGDDSRSRNRLVRNRQKSFVSSALSYLGSAVYWLSPVVLGVLLLNWAFGGS